MNKGHEGGQKKIMKEILGIAVKFILSVLAVVYFISKTGVMYGIICGGICYGLLSYIQWAVEKWRGLGKGIGLLVLYVLGAVALLSIFTIALNSILPNGIGAKIAAFLIIVMCMGFMVRDIKVIIQFLKKSRKN